MAPELIAQLRVLLWALILFILYVGPFVFVYVTYWLLSLPMRRRERARLVLHLIDVGAAAGISPERALVQASSTRDRMLGRRFEEFAAYLSAGVPMREALAHVPRMLPPQVAAILSVGAESGDIRRVIPACRQVLDDAISQTRGAINYMAVLAFVLLPVVPFMFVLMTVFVAPKFEQITADMGSGRLPPVSEFVFHSPGLIMAVSLGLMLLFQATILCYILGPRGRALFGSLQLTRLMDRAFWALPWRRNRLKRDFTTMLAVLLDAGVPEQRAVTQAALSTANTLVQARAEQVAAKLAGGASLKEALAIMDESGEVRWRIDNARREHGGFFAALRGWLETLDARAFQQEQTAAQLTTTALVLVHGLLVGLLVVAMFGVLINLTNEAVLW